MPRIPGLRRAFRLARGERQQAADEVDDELQFHLEMLIAELIASGTSPDAARAEAVRRFGDIEYTRRYCRGEVLGRVRQERRTEWLDELSHDLRFSIRQLIRTPGFTLMAVLTLSLGIGASTTIFSIVNGIILQPLPYRDPNRLIRIWSDNPRGIPRNDVSPAEFFEWRERSRQIESMAAYTVDNAVLHGSGDPVQVATATVSPAMFDMLGAVPLVGRTLRTDDELTDARVAVIGYALWQQRFGGRRDVIGSTIDAGGSALTVVGVMGDGFRFPSTGIDLWTPLPRALQSQPASAGHFLAVIGRLRPGAELAKARAELVGIAHNIHLSQHAADSATVIAAPEWSVTVADLRESIVGDVRTPLLVLLAGVAAVMLIACANVANLLLARAATRRREMAVRTALGATRWRMLRQLLTESITLALLAGATGVLLAVASAGLVRTLGVGQLPRAEELSMDGRALLFALGLSLATGVIFGLVPAIVGARPEPGQVLRGGAGAGRRQGRGRAVFLVTQVALTVVLLVSAGLLARSFTRLRGVDPGFRPDHLLLASVALPTDRMRPTEWPRFFDAALARVAALPGVEDAGVISPTPLSGGPGFFRFGVTIDGRPPQSPDQPDRAYVRWTSPGYFGAAGIRLLRGRGLNEGDVAGAPPVVVIDETFARQFFANENPVGRLVRASNDRGGMREIIGVVGAVRQTALDAAPEPHLYVPYRQWPSPVMTLVIRTSGDPLGIAASVQREVRAIDPTLPPPPVRTAEDLIAASVMQPRLRTELLGAFATAALLLAAVGLYGVVSYGVSQRTREIGVRVALGATKGEVLRLVVGEGVTLVLLGTGLGLLGAFAVTRALSAMLFTIGATDPATFVVVPLVLLGVAAVSSALPARRAARIDPVIALRAE